MLSSLGWSKSYEHNAWTEEARIPKGTQYRTFRQKGPLLSRQSGNRQ